MVFTRATLTTTLATAATTTTPIPAAAAPHAAEARATNLVLSIEPDKYYLAAIYQKIPTCC